MYLKLELSGLSLCCLITCHFVLSKHYTEPSIHVGASYMKYQWYTFVGEDFL